MFDIPATPAITSTSPSSARLCASNSAMRLTWVLAASGSERWRILRTVSAGPTISLPGNVGLSTVAPITPSGTPSSSITSEIRLVHSPSARNRSTAPAGGFGVDCIRMRSAAIRPVSFLSGMARLPRRGGAQERSLIRCWIAPALPRPDYAGLESGLDRLDNVSVRVDNLVKDGAKRRRLRRSLILDKIINTNNWQPSDQGRHPDQ